MVLLFLVPKGLYLDVENLLKLILYLLKQLVYILSLILLMCYVYCFSCVEPSLYSWDEAHLVIVYYYIVQFIAHLLPHHVVVQNVF